MPRLPLVLALALSSVWMTVTAHKAPPPVTPYPSPVLGDPCDFTAAFAFDRDQVLACYRSVPFCPEGGAGPSCDRDAQVTHLRAAIEGFSDLRNIYDATGHWRAKLDAVAKADFKSDFDFWQAMGGVMASFKNPHWSYAGPACFEQTLFALIPLEFGSMMAAIGGKQQQIVYLRDPYSFFTDLYLTATGIDVAPYTGQRVVTINGQPALEFLRLWARDGLHWDSDDGINLMVNLLYQGYTLRSGSFNALPESRSVTLQLETKTGMRTKVELPWAFIPFTALGFPGPLPASTTEFRELCYAPAQQTAAASKAAPGPRVPREPVAYDERLRQRRSWIDALAAMRPAGSVVAATSAPPGYSEVPPELQGKGVVEVLPLRDGARTVAYGRDTVAIQLRGDFLEPWQDEFQLGARFACEQADRLIVDLRSNGGGYLRRSQWLAHYLNPSLPVIPDAVFGLRQLATSPALNELRTVSEVLVSLGYDRCTAGYEPACFVSVTSGRTVLDPRWFANITREQRGNSIEALTPLVTYRSIVPFERPVIPCPGKFTGKNLVVLLNGFNASAAFFSPELLQGVGTLVVAGGFAGEPMQVGGARGGPVVPTSVYQVDADFLHSATGIPIYQRLPDLPRPVSFRIEYDALYKPDLKRLYADTLSYGDLQVPFWSTSQETDGAAYRTVVSAVERRALVDPVCPRPRAASGCTAYDTCAGAALDRAVSRRAVTAESAARTRADAVAACRQEVAR